MLVDEYDLYSGTGNRTRGCPAPKGVFIFLLKAGYVNPYTIPEVLSSVGAAIGHFEAWLIIGARTI